MISIHRRLSAFSIFCCLILVAGCTSIEESVEPAAPADQRVEQEDSTGDGDGGQEDGGDQAEPEGQADTASDKHEESDARDSQDVDSGDEGEDHEDADHGHGDHDDHGAAEESASFTDPDRTVSLTIREEGVEGAEGRLELGLGERVRLEISIAEGLDIYDDVHLHGYDLLAEIGPDKPAVLQFVADIPGVFEAELESEGRQVVEFMVR